MNHKLLLLLLALYNIATAQTLPAERATDWSLAGYPDTIPTYGPVLDITSYGAVGDGVAVNDTCIINAIAALNGNSGTIYFPTGNYFFTQRINLPDSVVLKGASADSTTLSFNLNGNNNLISIGGSIGAPVAALSALAAKDSNYILLDDASTIEVGDYLRISFNDASLLFSTWAYGSVGQVVRVKQVTGNKVELYSALRRSYSLADSAKVRIITPRVGCGIECLKIDRLDASVGQTTNIDISYAANCWLRGVESNNCNFAHVALSTSTNIEITGCYLHHAHAYGDGGQGYGVAIQSTSGECLIENNIFNHLRHSLLLQSGANGNVCAYNYSMDPFWENLPFIPANSAGDIVMHGNYPYLNLIEGNIVQNMMVDNSHGLNGPHNTFFRNRAELYGFIMSDASVGDDQNIVGNEITGTGALQGQYVLAGNGHFAYGNNIKGTVQPTGTSTLSDTSYYKNGRPAFLSATVSYPPIGYPNTIGANSINAKDKQAQGELTDCESYGVVYDTVATEIQALEQINYTIYPNPSTGIVHLQSSDILDANVYVSDVTGKQVAVYTMQHGKAVMQLGYLSQGLYFVQVQAADRQNTTSKLFITQK